MKKHKITAQQLRSYRWYGKDDLRSFGHRSRINQMGLADQDYQGKPIIGIVNSWNEMNTCHTHFPERVQDIKRGIYQAGGFPVEIPVMSLGEQLMKPTAMLYRNFLAMEVEEVLRAYPIDGAVLMGGCDKTTPALLMGAINLNIPAIYMPAGAMIRGNLHGKTIGSGTDVWKYWDDRQAGLVSDELWNELQHGIARSAGTCMTMGTAATMMIAAEALGMALPGSATLPAVDSSHKRMAAEVGRRAVEIVWEQLKPTDILSLNAFYNAITVNMAVGGSTNAIIHLVALAKRCGFSLPLEKFDEISSKTPLIVNLKPSGEYVMEDLYYAGGIKAVMNLIKKLLHLQTMTINGKTIADNVKNSAVHNTAVIHPLHKPLLKSSSTVILKGSLAPEGAVLKISAMEKKFLYHKGPALVFSHIAELKARINDDDLPVTKDTVIILQNAGPKGAPGMPEWGQLPIPKKLLQQGVRDIVRISDARMSGTSYGCCILHISPESAVGGPLAFVRNGDIIELNVEKRSLNLLISEQELTQRKNLWKPPIHNNISGFTSLYIDKVNQAHQGCDFDFLVKEKNSTIQEPDIF